MDQPTRVTVRLSDADADGQQLDDLTRRLRGDLLELSGVGAAEQRELT